jgi:hypothetical protein
MPRAEGRNPGACRLGTPAHPGRPIIFGKHCLSETKGRKFRVGRWSPAAMLGQEE